MIISDSKIFLKKVKAIKFSIENSMYNESNI